MSVDPEQLRGDPNQSAPGISAVEAYFDPEGLRAELEKARALHREYRRACDAANAVLRSMGGDAVPVLDDGEVAEPIAADIRNAGSPRLMRAEHAARYVGERSVRTFRRAVGTLYPHPIKVPGKGERWLKEAIDQAVDKLSGKGDGPPLAELL